MDDWWLQYPWAVPNWQAVESYFGPFQKITEVRFFNVGLKVPTDFGYMEAWGATYSSWMDNTLLSQEIEVYGLGSQWAAQRAAEGISPLTTLGHEAAHAYWNENPWARFKPSGDPISSEDYALLHQHNVEQLVKEQQILAEGFLMKSSSGKTAFIGIPSPGTERPPAGPSGFLLPYSYQCPYMSENQPTFYPLGGMDMPAARAGIYVKTKLGSLTPHEFISFRSDLPYILPSSRDMSYVYNLIESPTSPITAWDYYWNQNYPLYDESSKVPMFNYELGPDIGLEREYLSDFPGRGVFPLATQMDEEAFELIWGRKVTYGDVFLLQFDEYKFEFSAFTGLEVKPFEIPMSIGIETFGELFNKFKQDSLVRLREASVQIRTIVTNVGMQVGQTAAEMFRVWATTQAGWPYKSGRWLNSVLGSVMPIEDGFTYDILSGVPYAIYVAYKTNFKHSPATPNIGQVSIVMAESIMKQVVAELSVT